jgi:hypothetical protein
MRGPSSEGKRRWADSDVGEDVRPAGRNPTDGQWLVTRLAMREFAGISDYECGKKPNQTDCRVSLTLAKRLLRIDLGSFVAAICAILLGLITLADAMLSACRGRTVVRLSGTKRRALFEIFSHSRIPDGQT